VRIEAGVASSSTACTCRVHGSSDPIKGALCTLIYLRALVTGKELHELRHGCRLSDHLRACYVFERGIDRITLTLLQRLNLSDCASINI
jgi:hypothetical protein